MGTIPPVLAQLRLPRSASARHRRHRRYRKHHKHRHPGGSSSGSPLLIDAASDIKSLVPVSIIHRLTAVCHPTTYRFLQSLPTSPS